MADGDLRPPCQRFGAARGVSRGLREGEARRRRARGSFAVATYNILDGRGEGLYSAARALERANVDIAVVQETKILDPAFATKQWAGYEIKLAASGSTSCGGGGFAGAEERLGDGGERTRDRN